MPPPWLQEWGSNFLSCLGAPDTPGNRAAIAGWQTAEGAPGDQGNNFNPFNIGPGHSFGSVANGAMETCHLVAGNPAYGSILQGFKTNAGCNNIAASQGLATWGTGVNNHNWLSVCQQGPGTSTGAAPSGGGGGNCFAQFPVVGGCIISASNLKALKAGLLVAAGGIVLGIGVILIMSEGLKGTSAGKAAVRSYNRLPILPTTGQLSRTPSRPRRRPSSSRSRSPSRPRGTTRSPSYTSLDRRLATQRQRNEDEDQYQTYLSRGGNRQAAPQRVPGETRLERESAEVDMF